MQNLQIIFTVLAAICIAALIPLGAIFGWGYAILCAMFAVLFFLLMKLCKQSVDSNASPLSPSLPTDESEKTESEPSESKNDVK